MEWTSIICDLLSETRHILKIFNSGLRWFIHTGHFSAKLRLLHQQVTGGFCCILLSYEAWLCYYMDDISSNSQAGQWNTGTCFHNSLIGSYTFFKKHNFTCPQSVYGICLWTNVRPPFHHCCLYLLSLSIFKLPMCKFYLNAMVYKGTKIYCSKVNALHFLEKSCAKSTMLFVS